MGAYITLSLSGSVENEPSALYYVFGLKSYPTSFTTKHYTKVEANQWVLFQTVNAGWLPLLICNFLARLHFQSGSQCMLESLYLMCKEKHHKSQRHSSIFFDGSPNHSVGEKADTSLFDWVQIGSYLAMDSSDFWLIYQAQFCSEIAGEEDSPPFQSTIQCLPLIQLYRILSENARLEREH